MKAVNTSTVKVLREENNRNLEHWGHNSQRYHRMEMEIGIDAMMMVFPAGQGLARTCFFEHAAEVRDSPNSLRIE
jgi:protein-arginine kinase activator protein McsA